MHDLASSKYEANILKFIWLKDRNAYLYESERSLYFTNLDDNSKSMILNISLVENREGMKMDGYFVSPDAKYVLFYTNFERIYRYSFKADYHLYSLSNNSLQALSSDKQGFTNALFSPDSQKIAFVYNNNIYLRNLETGEEMEVTSGDESIKNGIQSWVKKKQQNNSL